MSVLARMKNMFKGFLSTFVSDMEKSNPAIAYQNAISSLTEKHARLKNAAAALVNRKKEIESRLDQAIKDKEGAEYNLQGAVNIGNEELGVACIQTIEEREAEIQDLQKELEVAATDCEEAKKGLLNIQQEIFNLKSEKDRMISKLESAEARNRAQEQIEGISIDAEMQALNNVRENIKNAIAKADLNRELNGTDLHENLKEMTKEAAQANAKNRFAQMRAEQEKNAGVAEELQELVERSEEQAKVAAVQVAR